MSALKKTEQELTISRGKVVSLEAEGKAQATRIEELTRYTHVDVVNYFVNLHTWLIEIKLNPKNSNETIYFSVKHIGKC